MVSWSFSPQLNQSANQAVSTEAGAEEVYAQGQTPELSQVDTLHEKRYTWPTPENDFRKLVASASAIRALPVEREGSGQRKSETRRDARVLGKEREIQRDANVLSRGRDGNTERRQAERERE